MYGHNPTGTRKHARATHRPLAALHRARDGGSPPTAGLQLGAPATESCTQGTLSTRRRMLKKRKKKRKKKKQASGGSSSGTAVPWPTQGGGAPSAPGLVPGAPTAPYVAPAELAPAPAAGYLLEPGDPHYNTCVRQCYRGFVHQPSGVPAPVARRLLLALEALKKRGYFHCDVVQGMGSWMPTFVRRILVGVPGMTYSYLGLRIFAHPWAQEAGATPEMEVIAQTNATVTAMTQQLLNEGKGVGKGGRCDYNVTLINLMEEHDHRGGALRNKSGNNLGGGQVAVSWHSDSSLEHFSSIAVLNLHIPRDPTAAAAVRKEQGEKKVEDYQPFRIALRCVGEGHDKKRGGGTRGTPAVAVPLGHGDAYYMLNDFNHHHHHAVLAGSGCGRYSSTHRVAVTERDTYDSIERRAAAAVAATAALARRPGEQQRLDDDAVVEALRGVEGVHSELEFDWLRQWGVQGQAHAETHSACAYWPPRMAQLRQHWQALEARTATHCTNIVDAAAAATAAAATNGSSNSDGGGSGNVYGVALLRRCCDVLLEALTLRRGRGVETADQSSTAGAGEGASSGSSSASASPGVWGTAKSSSSSASQLGGGRAGWGARIQHSAYSEVESRYRPFDYIKAPMDTQLEETIAAQIDALTQARAQLMAVAGADGGSGIKRRRTEHSQGTVCV